MGYRNPLRSRHRLRGMFGQALLINGSPYLEDLTTEAFAALRAHPANTGRYREMIYALQRACAGLGYCDPPVRTGFNPAPGIEGTGARWAASHRPALAMIARAVVRTRGVSAEVACQRSTHAAHRAPVPSMPGAWLKPVRTGGSH